MALHAWSGDNIDCELGETLDIQDQSGSTSGVRVGSKVHVGMATSLLDKGSVNSRLEGVIATLSAKEIVDTKLSTYKVVVFTKKGCPYSLGTKNMFRKFYRREIAENEVNFTEINRVSDMSVLNYLKLLSGGTMMPMVFVNGQFVGGSDETKDIHDSGQLARMLGQNADI